MISAFIVHSLLAALPCSLELGPTQAVIRVERDTVLAFGYVNASHMPELDVPSPRYATPETLMPAGRVRILQLDTGSRAALVAQGIRDSQPVAFIKAAPYGPDCRVLKWTDTIPFVVRGEVGYIRGVLAARDHWIDGVPVFVIPQTWDYPYPRRQRRSDRAKMNSAQEMFLLGSLTATSVYTQPDEKRSHAIEWATAHAAAAELEPARGVLREAILTADWEETKEVPSRLRGTYRVDVETGGRSVSWFFRTHDRPDYLWGARDSLQTTVALLASPHIPGYSLLGYGAASQDSLVTSAPRGERLPLVWFGSTDRPTIPTNNSRRTLAGSLTFTLAAVPATLWDIVDSLVPPLSARDSAFLARVNVFRSRSAREALVPLTVRLDDRGTVRADTTVLAGGKTVRFVLQRIDTVSVRRPW